jgi:hypothetical protein
MDDEDTIASVENRGRRGGEKTVQFISVICSLLYWKYHPREI